MAEKHRTVAGKLYVVMVKYDRDARFRVYGAFFSRSLAKKAFKAAEEISMARIIELRTYGRLP